MISNSVNGLIRIHLEKQILKKEWKYDKCDAGEEILLMLFIQICYKIKYQTSLYKMILWDP